MPLLLHLYVLVCRRRRRRRRSRCGLARLLRDHALQVDLNGLTFKDTEVALGADVGLIRASGADDTDRSVVDRELLVLLQRLAECVQAVDADSIRLAWVVGGYINYPTAIVVLGNKNVEFNTC